MKKVLSLEEIKEVSKIGEKIWREHYTPIIGKDQVEYMLEKFQSVEAISNQIKNEGYEYYLLEYENKNAGYIGIKVGKEDLFLSKLYVTKDFRKKGLASEAINFLKDICKEKNLHKLWLTVNKYNTESINAYKRLGFNKIDEQVSDIGNGFVMDDYILAINLLNF